MHYIHNNNYLILFLSCVSLRPQLQSLVEDLRQESECLQSQVSQERQAVKSLESLLQTGREKEFQNQLCSQERNTEIQMLKDRLSLNDSKM